MGAKLEVKKTAAVSDIVQLLPNCNQASSEIPGVQEATRASFDEDDYSDAFEDDNSNAKMSQEY